MEKSRINFKNYEIVDSGAKFYKSKDSEEGFYHVCDEYAPGGTRLLEFMPEIYRHYKSGKVIFIESFEKGKNRKQASQKKQNISFRMEKRVNKWITN